MSSSLPPPEIGCHVTHGYLRVLNASFSLNSWQFEQWLEPLNELTDMANHAGGSRQLQHQRAFYSVELMASRFHVQTQLPDRRSREGLNRLIKAVRELLDDKAAAEMERTLVPEYDEGLSLLNQDIDIRIAYNLQKLCEAAELLRQSLKNEAVNLSRIGKRLAQVARSTPLYIDSMIVIARELLEYTEKDRRKAWEHRTK